MYQSNFTKTEINFKNQIIESLSRNRINKSVEKINEIQKNNAYIKSSEHLNLPQLKQSPKTKPNKNSDYYKHVKSLKQKTDSLKNSPRYHTRIPSKEEFLLNLPKDVKQNYGVTPNRNDRTE